VITAVACVFRLGSALEQLSERFAPSRRRRSFCWAAASAGPQLHQPLGDELSILKTSSESQSSPCCGILFDA